MDPAIVVKHLTLIGLVAIMLSAGLKVTAAEVVESTRNPRLFVLSLAANFVLVPAVTVGLLYLFDANPMVSAGFLILAVCPGAPVGPLFAAVAKGDVPSAVGQMVVLGGLSAVLSPVLLSLLLPGVMTDGELSIDYLAIVRALVIAQMLPLAIGLAIHHYAPRFSQRSAKGFGLAANLLLLAAIVLVLVNEYETLALIRLRGWGGMLSLLAASLAVGWLCGGPDVATRKTLALTTAARNAAVALVIVSSNFADTSAVTAVVAYSFVSIFGTLACAALLGRVRKSKQNLG
jgi:BASS family bile acid:Na+ symporter